MNKPTLRMLLDSTEAGDEITKATLEWHYKYMKEETDRLMSEECLYPYQYEDAANNKKYMEAIRITLSIFGVRV